MNQITKFHSGDKFPQKNILSFSVLRYMYDFYSFRLWDKQGKVSSFLIHPATHQLPLEAIGSGLLMCLA